VADATGIQETLCVIDPKMYLDMHMPSHHPISGHRSSILTTWRQVVGDVFVDGHFSSSSGRVASFASLTKRNGLSRVLFR
jgi:hypothetical protein